MKRPFDRAYWLSILYGCYHSCRMFTSSVLQFYQLSLGFNPADLFFLHGFHSLALCALDLPISLYADKRKRHTVVLGGMGILTAYYAALWKAAWITGGSAKAIWILVMVTELLHSIGRSAISGSVEGWIAQILAEENRQKEYSNYSYRTQDYSAGLSILTSILGVLCAQNKNLGYASCFGLAWLAMSLCFIGFSFFAYYWPPTYALQRKKQVPNTPVGSVIKNLVGTSIGQMALLASVCISLERGISYHFWQTALFHRKNLSLCDSLPPGVAWSLIACTLGPFATQYCISRFIKKKTPKGRNYLFSGGVTIFAGASCGLLLAASQYVPNLSAFVWVPLFCCLQGAIAVGQTVQQSLYLESANAQWATSSLSFMFLIGRIASFIQSRGLSKIIGGYGIPVGRWIFVLPSLWGFSLGCVYLLWVRELKRKGTIAV